MKNKKAWLIIGVSAVIIAVAGAVAMAASSDDACITQMGSQHQIMMDQMVKDGVISAEQANSMQARMTETMTQHREAMPGMMNNVNGGCHGSQSAATSNR